MSGLRIFDNVLVRPQEYREKVLKLPFLTYDFGFCKFHGIAVDGPCTELLHWIKGKFSSLTPTLTFFRKSPLGQEEPHYIHTDVDMGDWSALLYLNPEPKQGDGTTFWTHRPTGTIESSIPHERSREGDTVDNWDVREHVHSKFNRAVLFPSTYFHSRAIHENWGDGDDARLVQVVFGTGVLS
jgi:hypothetical protein